MYFLLRHCFCKGAYKIILKKFNAMLKFAIKNYSRTLNCHLTFEDIPKMEQFGNVP